MLVALFDSLFGAAHSSGVTSFGTEVPVFSEQLWFDLQDLQDIALLTISLDLDSVCECFEDAFDFTEFFEHLDSELHSLSSVVTTVSGSH